MRRSSALFWLISFGLTSASATSSSPIAVDQPYLWQQSELLYTALGQAVTSAGGDLEKQHLHVVFAFSTGHFARDPVMAEAARVVASDLAANKLVNGDQVSAYAWEMEVWPHKGAALNPLKVGADRAALRASFQDLWPRSPQAGSVGGHDTEAAITQIAAAIQERDQADTVIVLLTNSAASAAGTREQRTIGENASAYQDTLTRWTRVKTSNTTGASVQLGIQPDRPDRTFDAVLVVPQAFKGAALDQPRSELLTEQVTAPGSTQTLPWWVWPLAALGIGAVTLLIIRALNNRSPATERAEKAAPAPKASRSAGRLALKIGDRTFDINSVSMGEAVCVVCGTGYPVGTTESRSLVLKAPELPALKLLTVIREKNGLKLQAESDAVLGGEAPALLPYKKDAEYRVRISGRAASRPGFPPRPYQTDLTLSLIPAES